jgi:hypothetical protein
MSDGLINAIMIALQPLAKSYELKVIDEESDRNYAAVKYANASTGLKVAIDWSELRPFLTLYELQHGVFPPDPLSIGVRGARRLAFDVDDLLVLRQFTPSPVGKMLARRDDQEAMRLLGEYARALDQKVSDVLCGDFTVFDELERVVLEREKQFREERR